MSLRHSTASTTSGRIRRRAADRDAVIAGPHRDSLRDGAHDVQGCRKFGPPQETSRRLKIPMAYRPRIVSRDPAGLGHWPGSSVVRIVLWRGATGGARRARSGPLSGTMTACGSIAAGRCRTTSAHAYANCGFAELVHADGDLFQLPNGPQGAWMLALRRFSGGRVTHLQPEPGACPAPATISAPRRLG